MLYSIIILLHVECFVLQVQITFVDEYVGHGLRTGMAAIFIAGEMAGIGMLAAPWAVVNLGELQFVE